MVMNNQKEEIKSLQQQMDLQNNQIHNLRQRLLMSVAQSASKESLAENNAKQCQESEEKRKQTFQQYSALKKEAQVMQCTLIGTQDQLTALKVDYDKVKEENNTYAAKLTDCKTRYENQITQLSEQLQKERLEKQEVEVTVDQLHKQLKKQTEIASERIKKANKKLKEFFKTIQVFLELACKANSSSCFHFEQAERIAARIFNIPSKDVQKITNLITNLPELQDRIEYSKSLVGKDEFSKEMAQFLYSVTLSSKNVSI
ncbi:uncharacterized protein LOC142318203 [Lycorma delicatula]|uniref:uncharacterized protein LOC142318203 n=1 Tax=Lycorma delicatula TaxID=130591 RepID=UPI003F516165